MPSHAVSQLLPFPDRYLDQCRVRNGLVESETHVPPTADEARALMAYLNAKGLNAMVVGSVGVLHHLRGTPEEGAFRPTVDLDVFVRAPDTRLREIGPPEGWTVDAESIGVVSWISPSGGYVDFLTSGHQFPSGERVPASLEQDPKFGKELPVAHAFELFKLKLSSMRAKDLTDLLSLAKARGLPVLSKLGKLNDTQRENYGLIRQWLARA